MMKKFLFYFVALVALIQVIRPSKNRSDVVSENTAIVAPENIQSILNKSCNDCHSNNTNYEWYHNIAPVSWLVALHIKQGKNHVNFDNWATYLLTIKIKRII